MNSQNSESTTQNAVPVDLVLDGRAFKGVTTFQYLGNLRESNAKCNNHQRANTSWIQDLNYTNLTLLRNKLLHHSAKMQSSKTLIPPVVSAGDETWTLTEDDKEKLRKFERKVIRKS